LREPAQAHRGHLASTAAALRELAGDGGGEAAAQAAQAGLAAGPLGARARETLVEQTSLVLDPYAAELLAADAAAAVVRDADGDVDPEERARGQAEALATRFLDDGALVALREHPDIKQVVSIGVGGDTRPYRLPLPAGLVYYEAYPDTEAAFGAAYQVRPPPASNLDDVERFEVESAFRSLRGTDGPDRRSCGRRSRRGASPGTCTSRSGT